MAIAVTILVLLVGLVASVALARTSTRGIPNDSAREIATPTLLIVLGFMSGMFAGQVYEVMA